MNPATLLSEPTDPPASGSTARCLPLPCGPSIARRLSRAMALLMFVALGVLSVAKYSAIAMRMEVDQQTTLDDKREYLSHAIGVACENGEAGLLQRMTLFDPVRSSTRLQMWRGDGSVLFRDEVPPFAHSRSLAFDVPAERVAGGKVRVQLEMDTTHDHRIQREAAITLFMTTLFGSAAAGFAIQWLVRRELRPLRSLTRQMNGISPRRLDQRLVVERSSEELDPWVAQFNALMDRLQKAYEQLEAFNADVAHELRTPLTALIGQTEVTLSRERNVESLRDTLASNLEEMQRLSAIVNDMLFLSQADRGATARRSEPVSLAELAHQVAEFHEGVLDEAGLHFTVEGDARVAVDAALVKRAMSNLMGNASRFAEPGSTVRVKIESGTDGAASSEVQVVVENQGPAIEPQHLPHLFDRFFRADAARCCPDETHHGLGLAIVAAIARMHAGNTFARSHNRVTQIGFTLGPQTA
ncbi:heavy metal sensor signal transduction histidine kinase [Hydrogenophaga taeniospiralis CCUG 15921]|uniref:Sensor protein n=1 Tax=Hydrogenophaga taeniospiralis CCUG 15921 TaxID=1281780 RepID=A0A9X4S8S5_9BURK|nr:heavy metal sensor histidine kinase [Hydrogenophaga taeniospiralis]MDG5976772.1 heavy metal sensor signal transduction histidine kinase [Hydrogenophaga taeniospiralis CCUG 15921]